MIQNNNIENIIMDTKKIVATARKNVAKEINSKLLQAYWEIGRTIVENEQNGSVSPEYGKKLYTQLSKELTKEFGKGFSRSNLFNMRNFYLKYPIVQTVSGQLSWSHYCELLSISDESKRSFYEKEVINKLANTGIEIKQPQDILKDPYVFEFLGIPETKPLLEKDLEYKLIRHIEDFLLELGRGFMFVGSQQRITLNNTHYYVDMVFYNKILKAYVLIDLKMGKLKPENVGQINMYLNYYNTEINDEDDNPPIGIILCADKDEIAAEYALGGLNNQIFASKYTLYIPEKEKLIKEVECVLEKEKSEGVSNSGE
jgi:predicted nuclease of restriction endonuclease-like (RecB) superfamily